MVRSRWFVVVAGGLAVAGLLGFGVYGTSQPAAELSRETDPSQSPWVWNLNHAPGPKEQADLVVILRVREEPVDLRTPLTAPLRSTEGSERRLGASCPADGAGTAKICVQLVDLRQFGAPGDDHPLRMSVAIGAGEPGTGLPVKLDGHSLVGQPVIHSAAWANGELPLLTLRTLGKDQQFTSTVLIVVRHRFD